MTVTLDHIVIYVEDLDTATATYRGAGLTVNYGGQHTGGVTENALIVFADGVYIELIALVDGKQFEDTGFKGLLKATGEGYTGYALQSDNLEADLQGMHERGVNVGEIREGNRARPDGEQLAWKMAPIDDSMSPFVIQDVTDRGLRVVQTEETITHANGATGVNELLIRVPNLQEAIDHYGRMVGTPLMSLGVARFEVGTPAIVLTGDADGSMAPALVTLFTDEDTPVKHSLHGADFVFV
ncbi:MAG: VOC family protein [Chloroflexota bacterium]